MSEQIFNAALKRTLKKQKRRLADIIPPWERSEPPEGSTWRVDRRKTQDCKGVAVASPLWIRFNASYLYLARCQVVETAKSSGA